MIDDLDRKICGNENRVRHNAETSWQMPLPMHARILDKLLSSDVKADLLLLFNENPSLTERTDGIARRIGRTPDQINDDLKDLIDVGLLFKKSLGSTEVICYDRKRASEIRELISSQVSEALESD